MGTYIYLWLTHVDVWQKSTQYCKAIIFQLKIIFLKNLMRNCVYLSKEYPPQGYYLKKKNCIFTEKKPENTLNITLTKI